MKKDIKTKTVIVLGMHRSGTSLTAGILEKLGIHMGDNLSRQSKFNVFGHLEDKETRLINETILKESGGTWYNPPFKIFLSNEVKKKLKHILDSRSGYWGWKDPRTALTIHAYASLLVNPYFVVCLRDPAHIAHSLEQRGGDNDPSFEDGIRLSLVYYQKIISFLQANPSYPRIFISYSDTIKKPIVTAKRIALFLGIHPTRRQLWRIRLTTLNKSQIRIVLFLRRWKNGIKRLILSVFRK